MIASKSQSHPLYLNNQRITKVTGTLIQNKFRSLAVYIRILLEMEQKRIRTVSARQIYYQVNLNINIVKAMSHL